MCKSGVQNLVFTDVGCLILIHTFYICFSRYLKHSKEASQTSNPITEKRHQYGSIKLPYFKAAVLQQSSGIFVTAHIKVQMV